MPHLCKGGVFFFVQKFIKRYSLTFLLGGIFFAMLSAEMELINDGYIEQDAFEKVGGSDVAVCEQKPKKQVCWGLYSAGDFVSNR